MVFYTVNQTVFIPRINESKINTLCGQSLSKLLYLDWKKMDNTLQSLPAITKLTVWQRRQTLKTKRVQKKNTPIADKLIYSEKSFK